LPEQASSALIVGRGLCWSSVAGVSYGVAGSFARPREAKVRPAIFLGKRPA
jgi:hypothetical protein